MALEEKRALEEILIRPNSKTNGGSDGIALTYRTWVEKGGEEMQGTSSTEGPKPGDWEDPEVTDRLGQLAPSLQKQVNDLTAERDGLQEQIERLKNQPGVESA